MRSGAALYRARVGLQMRLRLLKKNASQRRDQILNGSIPKTLMTLSLPTLMMGVVQCAIPLIDGLFINNIVGINAADAVTFCSPIIGMVVGLAAGLGSAGMAVIGQTNGKGQLAEGRRISTQLIVFSSALGVALAPLLYFAAYPVSASVNAQISQDVFTYLALNALIVPFSFLESIYNAIKNANGNPEATFIRMVILLIVKVLFNALFIALLRGGIVGASMASLASNLIVTVWMYFELFVKKGSERLLLKGYKPDWAVIRTLIRVGFPTMLSNLMIYAGFYLITNEVEKYGPIVLNGQGIASSITNVCFTLPAAFGSAVTTMVSMNVGAGRSGRARKACWVGSGLSALTAAALIGLIVPLSGSLTVLFTRDAQVLSFANAALHIYTFSVVGFGVCMTQNRRVYRPRAHTGFAGHGNPAHLAAALPVYPRYAGCAGRLRRVLGQPFLQLHERRDYHRVDPARQMGVRHPYGAFRTPRYRRLLTKPYAKRPGMNGDFSVRDG